MRHVLFLIIAALSSVTVAQAEVYKCNGVFTDRPCDQLAARNTGGSSGSTAATSSSKDDATVRSKKKLLAHDLRTRLLKAGRKYDIEMDISEADDVCLDESSSLEECRKVVHDLDDKLDSRIVAHSAAASTEKPAPPKEVAHSEPDNQNNSVVVIQEPDYSTTRPIGPNGRRPPFDPGHGRDHHPDFDHNRPRPGERGYEPPGSGLPPHVPDVRHGDGSRHPRMGPPLTMDPSNRQPGSGIINSGR